MALCIRAVRIIVYPHYPQYATLECLFSSSKPLDDDFYGELAASARQVPKPSQWKKVSAINHGINSSMIPKAPWRILKLLRVKGFDSYLVGGCVRDLLLNKTPKDFDVITTAKLFQVKKEFNHAMIIGKRFPICRVASRWGTVEVSSFDTASKGSKLGLDEIAGKPDKDFIRWRDSLHRDFTVNSLFYDPFEKVIFDYANGIKDLKVLKLRTLIPAQLSFQEDCARILRGLRIAGRLGLTIAEDTAIAMLELSPSILSLSKSRIMMEMDYMFAYGASRPSLLLLHKFHLLERILPFQASYLDDQIKRKNVSSCLLINLLRHLDNNFSCSHPCTSVVWVGLLAFHQALAAYPQNPLVLRAFAEILYYGNSAKAIDYFQKHAKGQSTSVLKNELVRLENLVKGSIQALSAVKSLSKYMADVRVPSYVNSVFVPQKLGERSAQLFSLCDGIDLVKERVNFNIDFPMLYSGDVRENRFALGKILCECLGSQSIEAEEKLTQTETVTKEDEKIDSLEPEKGGQESDELAQTVSKAKRPHKKKKTMAIAEAVKDLEGEEKIVEQTVSKVKRLQKKKEKTVLAEAVKDLEEDEKMVYLKPEKGHKERDEVALTVLQAKRPQKKKKKVALAEAVKDIEEDEKIVAETDSNVKRQQMKKQKMALARTENGEATTKANQQVKRACKETKNDSVESCVALQLEEETMKIKNPVNKKEEKKTEKSEGLDSEAASKSAKKHVIKNKTKGKKIAESETLGLKEGKKEEHNDTDKLHPKVSDHRALSSLSDLFR